MLDEQGTHRRPSQARRADRPNATAVAERHRPTRGGVRPAGGNGVAESSEPRPTVRKINGPAAEPVDLAGVAGPAVIKRVLPVVLALLFVVLLLRRRK